MVLSNKNQQLAFGWREASSSIGRENVTLMGNKTRKESSIIKDVEFSFFVSDLKKIKAPLRIDGRL